MEEYQLTLNEKQLHIIIKAVESISRFNAGQVEYIFDDIFWNSDVLTHDKKNKLSEIIKTIIFPKLHVNESYGIGIEEDNKLSVIRQEQYELYREIRHQLEIIDPSPTYNVYKSKTIKYSDLPLIKLKKIKTLNNLNQ